MLALYPANEVSFPQRLKVEESHCHPDLPLQLVVPMCLLALEPSGPHGARNELKD